MKNTITISAQEYQSLIRRSEQLDILVRKAYSSKYSISNLDIEYITGIPYARKEEE